MMEESQYLEQFKKMLESKDMLGIKEQVSVMNEADLAELLEELEDADALII